MRLHHWQLRAADSGATPVLALHGLLGSADNLRALAMAQRRPVFGLDLRNHGRSPHCKEMDLPSMAGDVLEFMDAHQIPKCHLLGHSLGGKVAMQLALSNPPRCLSLLVIDIAPVVYPPAQAEIINALRAIDLSKAKSRREVDTALSRMIDDQSLRLFLLKNLARDDGGALFWRPNLQALAANYRPYLIAAPSVRTPFQGNALFLCGARSDYVNEARWQTAQHLFPKARRIQVPNAGHWPHAEQPEFCKEKVGAFFSN